MKYIELTQGFKAIVDDEDYDELVRYKWCYNNGYAVRNARINGKSIIILMHRVVMKTPDELEVDHEDGNELNNQKYNLRNCLHAINNQNKKIYSNNTSGYKGVHFFIKTQKWLAYIKINNKRIHLGYFFDILDAARAYDVAAIKYFGEFAKLNFNRSNYE